jgi:hypothetical protein
MLGAVDTTNGPDVAPTGTVKVIDVSLQRSIDTGAPFRATRFPPCEAPNPDPVSVTSSPIDAVVEEILEIVGAGAVLELTETQSIVAVSRVVVDWLLTARPI